MGGVIWHLDRARALAPASYKVRGEEGGGGACMYGWLVVDVVGCGL